jgi:hypothetical protein
VLAGARLGTGHLNPAQGCTDPSRPGTGPGPALTAAHRPCVVLSGPWLRPGSESAPVKGGGAQPELPLRPPGCLFKPEGARLEQQITHSGTLALAVQPEKLQLTYCCSQHNSSGQQTELPPIFSTANPHSHPFQQRPGRPQARWAILSRCLSQPQVHRPAAGQAAAGSPSDASEPLSTELARNRSPGLMRALLRRRAAT